MPYSPSPGWSTAQDLVLSVLGAPRLAELASTVGSFPHLSMAEITSRTKVPLAAGFDYHARSALQSAAKRFVGQVDAGLARVARIRAHLQRLKLQPADRKHQALVAGGIGGCLRRWRWVARPAGLPPASDAHEPARSQHNPISPCCTPPPPRSADSAGKCLELVAGLCATVGLPITSVHEQLADLEAAQHTRTRAQVGWQGPGRCPSRAWLRLPGPRGSWKLFGVMRQHGRYGYWHGQHPGRLCAPPRHPFGGENVA